MSEPTCGVCGRVLTPDALDPPTFSLQEHPDLPGVLRPVLNKRIRMDPETGAVCWCVDEDRERRLEWIDDQYMANQDELRHPDD